MVKKTGGLSLPVTYIRTGWKLIHISVYRMKIRPKEVKVIEANDNGHVHNRLPPGVLEGSQCNQERKAHSLCCQYFHDRGHTDVQSSLHIAVGAPRILRVRPLSCRHVSPRLTRSPASPL